MMVSASSGCTDVRECVIKNLLNPASVLSRSESASVAVAPAEGGRRSGDDMVDDDADGGRRVDGEDRGRAVTPWRVRLGDVTRGPGAVPVAASNGAVDENQADRFTGENRDWRAPGAQPARVMASPSLCGGGANSGGRRCRNPVARLGGDDNGAAGPPRGDASNGLDKPRVSPMSPDAGVLGTDTFWVGLNELAVIVAVWGGRGDSNSASANAARLPSAPSFMRSLSFPINTMLGSFGGGCTGFRCSTTPRQQA